MPLNSATARPSAEGDEKRVVLLGGDAGERLEPVGVVRGAVLDGPVLQRAGDDVGDVGLDRLTLRDGAAQRAVDVLRQPGALHFFVERERAEFFSGLALACAGRACASDMPQLVMLRMASSVDAAEPMGDLSFHELERGCHYEQPTLSVSAENCRFETKFFTYILNIVKHIQDYYAPITRGIRTGRPAVAAPARQRHLGRRHPARHPGAHRRANSRSASSTSRCSGWRRKGLVTSYVGEPTTERGGRRRRHYLIDTPGEQALGRSYRALRTMAEGLEERLASL